MSRIGTLVREAVSIESGTVSSAVLEVVLEDLFALGFFTRGGLVTRMAVEVGVEMV